MQERRSREFSAGVSSRSAVARGRALGLKFGSFLCRLPTGAVRSCELQMTPVAATFRRRAIVGPPTKTELADYLAALNSGAVDPGQGLPDPIFAFALAVTPMVNVDLFIRDQAGRTLVAWREDEFGRGWHIPGGIIRWRESIADRIAAVARLELGAEVGFDLAPCRVSQILGEARGHFISLLYRCVLRTPLPQNAIAEDARLAKKGQLYWADGMPDPIYPAHQIYQHLFAVAD